MRRRLLLPGLSGVVALLLLLLASCTIFERTAPDPWAAYRPALAPFSRSILDTRRDWPQYLIDFNIDPLARTISGRQTVKITNRTTDPWYDIYFRLYPNLARLDGEMEISSVTIDGKPAPYSYAAERSAIRVSLSEPLPPGAAKSIELTFQVTVPEPTSGYVLFGEKDGILNLPLSYPMLSVWDADAAAAGNPEPWHLDTPPDYADIAFAQAALYQVTATVPTSYTVVATGVVLTRTAQPEGTTTWRWVGAPSREWMMTMSPAFKVVSTLAYSTTVNSYYLPGDEEAGGAALLYAAAALRVYQDHYGRYPYPQMDIVASSLEYRGMEFPGLDLIGTDLYRDRRRDLEFLIAHEVAHQWFYNIVGSDPVRTPWLDEGLAEYSTYVYEQAVHGTAAADELLQTRWEIPVNYARNNGLDAVVNQPAGAFGASRYETMVYAKAALFFHAIHEAVGDDTYFRIVRAYVEQYRFAEAGPADFINLAERLSGKSLRGIYEEWILSAAPGG